MSAKEKANMRQEQAAATKRNLLDAAQKLFAENGYKATPVRSINKKIGMADGLLYHYFPGGKKEILQVIVVENFEKILARLRIRSEKLDELPLEEAIEQIYQNWQMVFSEYQDVIKILFKENEIMQLIERERLMRIAGNGGKWFPAFLQKRVEKGEIREMDCKIATEILSAVLFSHFLAVLTGVGSGVLSNEEHRKMLIAHQVRLWKVKSTGSPQYHN